MRFRPVARNPGAGGAAGAAEGARRPIPGHHDDLRWRDRAAGGRRAGASLRRGGADQLRERDHAAARKAGWCGATPASTPLSWGAATSPVPRWSTAWNGTCGSRRWPHRSWCASSPARSTATGPTRRSCPTTPTIDADVSTAARDARPRPVRVGIARNCQVWRCARTRTRSRSSRPSSRSAPSTDATAIWSWRRPAPERRSSPPWTTTRLRRTLPRDRRCCSSPTAGRSSSSRGAPTARCWPTARSARITSAATVRSGGSTSSPACSRWPPTASRTSRPTTSTSWSIDEFHHAEAPTYRRLLDHLAPRELLGLTATPERTDGVDVREHFDGRSAYELRLWDALGADLLVPFHYFGVSRRRRSDAASSGSAEATTPAALDNIYTGNDARAARSSTRRVDKVTDVRHMRALGFCVSVAHARVHGRRVRPRPASRALRCRAVRRRPSAPRH